MMNRGCMLSLVWVSSGLYQLQMKRGLAGIVFIGWGVLTGTSVLQGTVW